MERVTCLGTHEGVRLSNGTVAIVATTDIGPRIVEYALDGGINVLGEAMGVTIDTPLGSWRPYGGHRLWAAPEANPRSYVPDNDPVTVEQLGDLGVRLTPAAESPTGIAKSLTIILDESGSGASVLHTITNNGLWDVELAPWALTIVAPGGEAIVPQEPYRSHSENLLPARTLALWSYTDLSDPRLRFGRRFIRVKSQTDITEPVKIGIANAQGWAGWHRDGTLFIKRFDFDPDARYPDMGSNTEIYTAGDFIELESLGPLARLAPGATVEHRERWELYGDFGSSATDEELERALRMTNDEGW